MNVRDDMITVFVARPAAGTGNDAKHEFLHEFLQLRRAANDYMGGTWQIVRGGVHAGEAYVAAALRELREEADLSPGEFYRAGVESFYTDVDDTLWHAPAFCAIVDREALVTLNEEHDGARWVAQADIDRQTMWPSERALLRDLMRDVLRPSPAKAHLRIRI